MKQEMLDFIKFRGTAKSYIIEGRFSIDYRAVQQIVRDLRLDGELIGSGDDGYFICETKEQYLRFRGSVVSRCLRIFEFVRKMDVTAKAKFGLVSNAAVQLEMFEGWEL